MNQKEEQEMKKIEPLDVRHARELARLVEKKEGKVLSSLKKQTKELLALWNKRPKFANFTSIVEKQSDCTEKINVLWEVAGEYDGFLKWIQKKQRSK